MFSLEVTKEGDHHKAATFNQAATHTLTRKVWKIINSSFTVGVAGGAGSYYIGEAAAPIAVDASVRYVCNRFIKGFLGKLVANFAAPFFSNHLSKFAAPVIGIAGGVGTLGIYHSVRWIYHCYCPQSKEIDPEMANNIKLIVQALLVTSAIDPKKGDKFLNKIAKENPALAETVVQCLAEALLEIEGIERVEDEFDFMDCAWVEIPCIQSHAFGELILKSATSHFD